MEHNPLLNGLVLRILIFFAGLIAFVLTERQFAFDMKQKIKVFVSYFLAAYVGCIFLILLLGVIIDAVKNR